MTTLPKRALALSALALGAGAALAPAAQAGVTLDWTTANVANSAAPAGTERTWLGYVTNPAPFSAKGTASPLAPATGPTVTPASARGVSELATWKLPATTGSIELGSLRGAMEFDGGVRFTSPTPAPAEGHGFTISLEDPRVVLDGTGSGLLYASGLSTPGAPGSEPVPYNQDQPVFRLTGAAQSLNADGSTSISLVPEIATAGYAFPANYTVGAGPERTPNTFGSFSITVAPNGGPAGANGRDGVNGANGKDGVNGKDGKNGTTTVVRVQTTTLAKAPFKGKAARKVRVTARGKKAVLATGTVKGRKLNVTLAKGKKSLPGVVTLHVVGSKAKANVRL